MPIRWVKDGRLGMIVGQAYDVAKDDVAGTAVVIEPDGTNDVTGVLAFMGVVKASDGSIDAGFSYVTPGATISLYDSGGNTLVLSAASTGAITMQRTAGALTYDVALRAVWI